MMAKSLTNMFSSANWPSVALYLACVLLMVMIFLFDMAIPLGVAMGVLYIVVVLLSFGSAQARFIIFVAAVSSVLVMIAYLYKPPVADMWKVVFNRGLALFIIWVTAFLGLKLKAIEKELIELASHDPLTGFLNRRFMFDRLTVEVSRAQRLQRPFSMMLLDIDHFKKINDTYGHITGDIVLKELSKEISESIRDYDFTCRFGGEEFLLAIPETPLQQSLELAERLRVSIMQHTFRTETYSALEMTVSIGVTQLREGESIEAVISRVDAALYKAKESGRNRVVSL